MKYLLNTYRKESGRVAFHGLRASLIRVQSECIGFELKQVEVDGDDYEVQFKHSLKELKSMGIRGIIFGDIDIEQNRRWCERVCADVGLQAHFPLWNIDQKQLLIDFIRSGFKALIVSANSKFFGEECLGINVDEKWIDLLDRLRVNRFGKDLTYCGEMGEYHTFVFDGPIFRQPVRFMLGDKVWINGYWLIDVSSSY